MDENAQHITEMVTRIQKEFKCGICCSTFKDPIISTCFHIFCRECIEACFEKKRKLQCPICRQILDKRSCKDSFQHTQAVQNYLKLSEAFKKDIKNVKTFSALPPELAFCESQAPLDITIIPENDGKRVAPDFLIPLVPAKRKRASRTSLPSTSASTSVPVPKPTPELKEVAKFVTHKSPVPAVEEINVYLKPETNDASCQSDALNIGFEELMPIQLDVVVKAFRDSSPENAKLDDIDALFKIIPSSKLFFEKNIRSLMNKFGIEEKNKKEKEAKDVEDRENTRISSKSTDLQNFVRGRKSGERRVTFARIQETCEAPSNFTATESITVKTAKDQENSTALKVSSAENDDIVVDSAENCGPAPPPKSLVTARKEEDDLDDEVVADSEGEGETTAGVDVTTVSVDSRNRRSRLSDVDATFPGVQNESAAIEEDLRRLPIVIACSRISNDKDEELCSDFYSRFLSNSCRFSDEVSSQTTHLVMMNSVGRNIPQKSLSYVFAIAHKCIVVNRDWLVDCLKHNVLLDEADYTIKHCPRSMSAVIDCDSDDVSESMVLSSWLKARECQGPKLFSGYYFVIIRKYAWSIFLDYRKIIDLVRLCGGKIYDDYESARPSKLFFICTPQKSAPMDAARMEREFKCPVVTCEWVLDCVSEFRIVPHEEYLTKNIKVDF